MYNHPPNRQERRGETTPLFYPNLQYYSSSVNGEPTVQPVFYNAPQPEPQTPVFTQFSQNGADIESPCSGEEKKCKKNKNLCGLCVSLCCGLFACLAILFLITGLPNLFIFGFMRVDQNECLVLHSKSPAETTMLYSPATIFRNINVTIPNSLFYAQHVINIKNDKRVSRVEIESVVKATRRENLKDYLLVSDSKTGTTWNVLYRAKNHIFQKGCATIEMNIVLPMNGVEVLNLNIPASAQVNVENLTLKSLLINQRVANVQIPMSRGPKEPKHPAPAPLPMDALEVKRHKKVHREHRAHGIHRRVLSFFGKKCSGKRPGKRPFRPNPKFVELFAPKYINLTKSSIESLEIKTLQKVQLVDFSCASSTGKLTLVALQTNLSRVSGCESITINATEQYLKSVSADKITISSNTEKTNIELSKVVANHIVGHLNNGNMRIAANPSSLVDLERKNTDAQISVNLPEIVWFRNSELVKQGKWKCPESGCTHDIKVTVSNKGALSIVE